MTAFPLTRLLRLGLLVLLSLIFFAPYLFMIVTAMKTHSEIFQSRFQLIPETFALFDNLARVFDRMSIWRLLLNGVIVRAAIFGLQILVAIPCAYAMAKLRFAQARAMMTLVLLVPIHATSMPIYVGLSQTGLLNSYTALVAPFTISVFGIFLFLQFFRGLPDDLIHAARMDGMSDAGILLRVVVPNAWPAVTAFGIFSVVAHWNDLYWPLIVTSDQAYATPPLGLLYLLSAESGDDYGALMAATLLITLPLVAAFLLAQKKFVEGITMTGLKG